jgi:Adenylate and Guanylate cyclase catalytic domain
VAGFHLLALAKAGYDPQVLCGACGQENPEGFRFCGWCAVALDDSPPVREVRKVVTIVFCDLTGSTALGERTDPEALRATMRGYYEQMRAILERHGGTVEKFVGDAVMAVFGIPVSTRTTRCAPSGRSGRCAPLSVPSD